MLWIFITTVYQTTLKRQFKSMYDDSRAGISCNMCRQTTLFLWCHLRGVLEGPAECEKIFQCALQQSAVDKFLSNHSHSTENTFSSGRSISSILVKWWSTPLASKCQLSFINLWGICVFMHWTLGVWGATRQKTTRDFKKHSRTVTSQQIDTIYLCFRN